MPRDGSDVYIQPFPDVAADTTIESAVYNGFVADIATDLNAPRPIIAGGTEATDSEGARFNLSTGVATQVVTNYDSHIFWPGGFRSATSATNPPVASHAFAGIAYINEPLAYPATNANVVIIARDMTDTTEPGPVYVRRKLAGTWGAWTNEQAILIAASAIALDAKVDVAGDTMTGHLSLPTGPAAANAVRRDYVEAADTAVTSAAATAATAYTDSAIVARALRYDISQSLSGGQQTQAQNNMGGTTTGKALFTAAGDVTAFNQIKQDASTTATGVVEYAVQSEMETSDSNRAVSPSVQRFHPGHPKAWARVTSAAATTASYGISSVSSLGVGNERVNLSVTYSASTALTAIGVITDSSAVRHISIDTFTTTTFEVFTKDASNVAIDSSFSVDVYGDQ